MTARTRLSIAVLAGLLIAAGCSTPARTGDPVVQTFTTQDTAQQDALWLSCQEVLRERGFVIDLLDRRAGIITTYPQTSQHFFEFWRKDVDTAYDLGEASLRTVRRTVTVAVALDEARGESDVTVIVKRETFATPERQFNSSIAAFQMFGDQLPAAETGERITRADDYWIDAGRDLAMERYYRDCIIAQAG